MSRDERDPARRRSQSDNSALPPSFRPGDSVPRPTARGARPVGAGEHTRPLPREQARPAATPDEAPVRRSLRPAAERPAPSSTERSAPRPAAERPGARPEIPPAYAPRGSQGAPSTGPSQPAGPPAPGTAPAARPAAPPAPRKRRRRGRVVLTVLVLLLVLVLAWPVGLLIWANGRINHVTALSGAADTPGTTYLLAGSDSRADGAAGDSTEGQRSDTIMVLHRPESGPAALISLPRDTLTDIPGHGPNKLNASYSYGGPELLVESVEGLTGLTVDHYVEIGMAGVRDVVDAVGGVELCLDYDVDDWRSDLVWEAGCHPADGETALAFARMRYADTEGDIGRTDRQRQLVRSIISEVAQPATLLDPRGHVELAGSALDAIVVDDDTGIIDLARMALAFRSATGADGLVGTPPIADFDYRPGGVGSTVLLDPDRAPDFFARLRAGELTEADLD